MQNLAEIEFQTLPFRLFKFCLVAQTCDCIPARLSFIKSSVFKFVFHCDAVQNKSITQSLKEKSFHSGKNLLSVQNCQSSMAHINPNQGKWHQSLKKKKFKIIIWFAYLFGRFLSELQEFLSRSFAAAFMLTWELYESRVQLVDR